MDCSDGLLIFINEIGMRSYITTKNYEQMKTNFYNDSSLKTNRMYQLLIYEDNHDDPNYTMIRNISCQISEVIIKETNNIHLYYKNIDHCLRKFYPSDISKLINNYVNSDIVITDDNKNIKDYDNKGKSRQINVGKYNIYQEISEHNKQLIYDLITKIFQPILTYYKSNISPTMTHNFGFSILNLTNTFDIYHEYCYKENERERNNHIDKISKKLRNNFNVYINNKIIDDIEENKKYIKDQDSVILDRIEAEISPKFRPNSSEMQNALEKLREEFSNKIEDKNYSHIIKLNNVRVIIELCPCRKDSEIKYNIMLQKFTEHKLNKPMNFNNQNIPTSQKDEGKNKIGNNDTFKSVNIDKDNKLLKDDKDNKLLKDGKELKDGKNEFIQIIQVRYSLELEKNKPESFIADGCRKVESFLQEQKNNNLSFSSIMEYMKENWELIFQSQCATNNTIVIVYTFRNKIHCRLKNDPK